MLWCGSFLCGVMGLACWGSRSNSNTWALADKVDVFGVGTVVGC